MRDCPADWPKTKCPKELCFQIGFQPDDRDEGICWRCQAAARGTQLADRERYRPLIDRAVVERYIVPPEERRRETEEEGICWFCGHASECAACEVEIEARREKLLGKNAAVLVADEVDSPLRVAKKVRGGRVEKRQRIPSLEYAKTRARTRSQARMDGRNVSRPPSAKSTSAQTSRVSNYGQSRPGSYTNPAGGLRLAGFELHHASTTMPPQQPFNHVPEYEFHSPRSHPLNASALQPLQYPRAQSFTQQQYPDFDNPWSKVIDPDRLGQEKDEKTATSSPVSTPVN